MKTTIDSRHYSIGSGFKGNGLTVYNRAELDESNDFKTIAHISDGGKITYYSPLPKEIKTYIHKLKETMPCPQ